MGQQKLLRMMFSLVSDLYPFKHQSYLNQEEV